MDPMLLQALMVFLPPVVFGLIMSYLCDMSPKVFLATYATGMVVVVGAGGLEKAWLVIPILIVAYLVWTAIFGGAHSE
jgi:hypothetical protein